MIDKNEVLNKLGELRVGETSQRTLTRWFRKNGLMTQKGHTLKCDSTHDNEFKTWYQNILKLDRTLRQFGIFNTKLKCEKYAAGYIKKSRQCALTKKYSRHVVSLYIDKANVTDKFSAQILQLLENENSLTEMTLKDGVIYEVKESKFYNEDYGYFGTLELSAKVDFNDFEMMNELLENNLPLTYKFTIIIKDI